MNIAAVERQLQTARGDLAFWLVKLRMRQLAGHCPKLAEKKVAQYTGEIAAYVQMLNEFPTEGGL